MYRCISPVRGLFALSLLWLAQGIQAAGFELPHQGIKEMGIAYGGSAALLEDASAVANNPAGLLRLEDQQISGGLALIRSEFDYDVEVHRELIDDIGGTVPGRNSGDISALSAAPHFYYSRRIASDAAVGLGIYAPFGTTTEYSNSWAGRYHATETDITAVNINPVFAFGATDTLSVGFGAVVQYLEGEFRNAIDLGYLVADEVLAQDPMASSSDVEDNLVHQFDVDNEMIVDNWGFGFNFGLLWEPDEQTRVGLNYRSRVQHPAEGESKRPQTRDEQFREDLIDAIDDSLSFFGGIIGSPEEGADQALGPLGAAGDDIRLVVDMPEIATLSAWHQLHDAVALTGGITWTNWSRLDELRFTHMDDSDRGGSDITDSEDDVRRRDLVQPFGWEDTLRFGVGAILRPELLDLPEGLHGWTFRGGVAFDESPVPDAERRTPRGPDNDRFILGLGASWQWTEALELDLGYTWTRFQSASINNRENPAGSEHRMEGDYKGRLHTLAAQLNYRF